MRKPIEFLDLVGIRRIGCEVAAANLNDAGRWVYLVTSVRDWKIPMFVPDINGLILGATTIEAIVQRNMAEDLGGPWPPLILPTVDSVNAPSEA